MSKHTYDPKTERKNCIKSKKRHDHTNAGDTLKPKKGIRVIVDEDSEQLDLKRIKHLKDIEV